MDLSSTLYPDSTARNSGLDPGNEKHEERNAGPLSVHVCGPNLAATKKVRLTDRSLRRQRAVPEYSRKCGGRRCWGKDGDLPGAANASTTKPGGGPRIALAEE